MEMENRNTCNTVIPSAAGDLPEVIDRALAALGMTA
jgi:hypothetical protein